MVCTGFIWFEIDSVAVLVNTVMNIRARVEEFLDCFLSDCQLLKNGSCANIEQPLARFSLYVCVGEWRHIIVSLPDISLL
jgi:hypothetical protein